MSIFHRKNPSTIAIDGYCVKPSESIESIENGELSDLVFRFMMDDTAFSWPAAWSTRPSPAASRRATAAGGPSPFAAARVRPSHSQTESTYRVRSDSFPLPHPLCRSGPSPSTTAQCEPAWRSSRRASRRRWSRRSCSSVTTRTRSCNWMHPAHLSTPRDTRTSVSSTCTGTICSVPSQSVQVKNSYSSCTRSRIRNPSLVLFQIPENKSIRSIVDIFDILK